MFMRPLLHFTAQKNWINDPNGIIYYNGTYHIFYQHFPYECHWGTMHWGHATTNDFIHFTHHPIALYPSKVYDQSGCFSGKPHSPLPGESGSWRHRKSAAPEATAWPPAQRPLPL